MPSSSNGSGGGACAGDADPDQPTQVPCRATRTGCSAVTSPPGLRRHLVPPGPIAVPSVDASADTRSTGSRLATTTNELAPATRAVPPPNRSSFQTTFPGRFARCSVSGSGFGDVIDRLSDRSVAGGAARRAADAARRAPGKIEAGQRPALLLGVADESHMAEVGHTVAQFIYVLEKARKAHGDKLILDNVTLAFLPGAKIGVLGPNGAGKSSLLRIMAGLDVPSNGEARLMPGYTVGLLAQEPQLDESKTVLGNIEGAVAETKAKLARFNEIAELMATEYSDELMAEMGQLQEELDHADAWDVDSKLELAMDGLRCAGCSSNSPTCCCSTSRPTTSTRRACSGWSSTWPSTPAPWWRSPTTGTSSITSPSGSSSSTGAGPTRTRGTTRRTWRRRRSGWRSRAARTPR